MPPAWGVEALANAGLATDSCCINRGRFEHLCRYPRDPRGHTPQCVSNRCQGRVWASARGRVTQA